MASDKASSLNEAANLNQNEELSIEDLQKEIEMKLNNCITNFDIIEISLNPAPLDDFTLFFDIIEIAEEEWPRVWPLHQQQDTHIF